MATRRRSEEVRLEAGHPHRALAGRRPCRRRDARVLQGRRLAPEAHPAQVRELHRDRREPRRRGVHARGHHLRHAPEGRQGPGGGRRVRHREDRRGREGEDGLARRRDADGLRVQKLQRVSPIAQNERRIALRVGTAPYYYLDQFGEYQSAYDYHFMYQTSSGNWAEKHGIGGDSICRYAGETPDSLSWDLANIISYYDSDIVYFAIGE